MASIATRDAYGEALAELGAVNENIVVLEADLSKSTKTSDFKKVYPERHFNMGIAEQNMLGVAAGFAAAGKIPFASSFAVFATGRAYDQIRNSIAYPNLNVKIAATHAGLTVGEDGGSHQMLEDIALMRALPNMTVIVPADGIETKQAIKAAAEYEGPVYIRMGRPKVPVLFDENYIFEIGKGVVLKEGTDVTLIGTGIMVSKAMEAAELLAADGISAAVHVDINQPQRFHFLGQSVGKILLPFGGRAGKAVVIRAGADGDVFQKAFGSSHGITSLVFGGL